MEAAGAFHVTPSAVSRLSYCLDPSKFERSATGSSEDQPQYQWRSSK